MEIVRLGVVGSTNREAAGHPIGTAVVARGQTGGRGRLDHGWESPEGGLYMSCVLPALDPPTVHQFWAAVAVADALAGLGLRPEVRWPNDVLVDGLKIAGILSEGHAGRAIVGIGVNVNAPMEHRPFGATSVAERLGREVDLEDIISSIVGRIAAAPEPTVVMSLWRQRSSTEGKRVRVRTLRGTVEGTAEHVADDGALVVRTADGTVRVVEGECRYLD